MANRRIRFSVHNSLYKDTWSVGIYVRLSDEDRDKREKTDLSQSIINQIAYIRSYIEMLNDSSEEVFRLKEYKVYCDDDHTGMNFKRDGFQSMMRDAGAGLIDCIIVKNLSRLGRYDKEMQQYLEDEFEQYGREIRLVAIGDNYDSLYKEIGVIDKVILLLNREYSEQQHRNVCIGMHAMQKKGLFVGAFPPYGYIKDPKDRHHLLPDPTASEVVKRIYEEYLSGVSAKEIAAGLTADGIVNPSTYKRLHGSNFKCGAKISDKEVHWRGDGVKRILMDEVYTGTLVQHKQVKRKLTDNRPSQLPKDQWIRCEGTHKALISKERWDIVQSMMKNIRRDTTKKDEITIFKGLLKCGDCKHAMRKKYDKYINVVNGGTSKYLYYNCGTYRDYSQKYKRMGENVPKCTSHYISDKMLRGIVIDDINKIISQVENLNKMVKEYQDGLSDDKTNTIQHEIDNKTKTIQKYQERMKAARGMLYDGIINRDEYESDVVDIQNDIERFKKEIHFLTELTMSTSAVFSNQWIQRLLENGKITELDRVTVVEFIEKIYVYEDKHIEIVYKFSDEFDHLFTDFV